jgi:hypothetical protein
LQYSTMTFLECDIFKCIFTILTIILFLNRHKSVDP